MVNWLKPDSWLKPVVPGVDRSCAGWSRSGVIPYNHKEVKMPQQNGKLLNRSDGVAMIATRYEPAIRDIETGGVATDLATRQTVDRVYVTVFLDREVGSQTWAIKTGGGPKGLEVGQGLVAKGQMATEDEIDGQRAIGFQPDSVLPGDSAAGSTRPGRHAA